uniref:Putative secreted peptide n=1 Tax=Anopheles braziliensis TaxID=58242 RepID=A0A2M3ZS43_9DIPT
MALLLLLLELLLLPVVAAVLVATSGAAAPSGGFTYPMLTISSSCISAWRTILPGLSSTPKHRSTSSGGYCSDGTCRTVMHTSLSVLQRNRKLDFTSRGTVTYPFRSFSLISSETANSYMADWIGLPAVSDVTEASITFSPLSANEVDMLTGTLGGRARWNAFAKQVLTCVTASGMLQRNTWHWWTAVSCDSPWDQVNAKHA